MEQIIAGKYRILEQLGRGGMGTVYKAAHTSLGREDAIKVLHPELSTDSAFVDRFLREARAMARLDHENVVRVYDVFEYEGIHCIAMEYFKGFSLRTILQAQQELKLIEIISIISQAANGLAYAHERGIVHRDVKPGNIMLNRKMEIKIADFGIAAAMDESSLTMTGELVGSPRYMPPEQARSEPIDSRSDLYSLGMVFYELITGTSPFEGDSGVAIIGKLAYDKAEIELSFPDTVPDGVQAVIRKLLRRSPSERYQSADELRLALVEIAGGEESVSISKSQTVIMKSDNSGVLTRLDFPTNQTYSYTTAPPKKPNYLLVGVAAGLVFSAGGIMFALFSNKEKPTTVVHNTPIQVPVPVANSLKDEVEILQIHLTDHVASSKLAQAKFNQLNVIGEGKKRFNEALKMQVDATTQLTESANYAARKNYTKAKDILISAEKQLQEAEKQFLLAYELAAKNTTFIAVEGLVDEALLLQQEVNKNMRRAKKTNAHTKNIPEFDRGIYFLNKADELFVRAKQLVKEGNIAKSKVVIDKATVAYGSASKYFGQSRVIANQQNYLVKVEEKQAKFRKLQLDVKTARLDAEQAGAQKHAPIKFKKADTLNDELTWQANNINRLIKKNRYRQSVVKIESALTLGKQTKAAYVAAYRDALSANKKVEEALAAKKAAEKRDLLAQTDRQSGKPSESDQKIVEQLIYSLARAYERKDLLQMKQMANISPANLSTISSIFKQYERVDVSVKSYSVASESASVEFFIDRLISSTGDEVIPGDSWRSSHLSIRKTKNGWEKFIWK